MSGPRIFTSVRGRVSAVIRHDNLILSVLAVVIGFAVGWAVVGFRELIDVFQTLGFGSGGENLATIAAALPMWQVIAVPTIGGLLIGIFYRFIMPGGRPRGVADVIEASALKGGRMPLWQGLAATFGSAASIGVGGSVGREGPAVLFGATLSSWIGQRISSGRPVVRILVGCGVAAAVAASFNAPIAGALFAHEIIIGHYALSAFAPVVMASVAATTVSRGIYGAYPAFTIPAFEDIVWIEFPAFALTGVACGLAAVVLMYGIRFIRDWGVALKLPVVLRPMLAGLVVGLIATQFPDVLGVGYEQTDRALNAAYSINVILILIALKLLATAICLGWGFGGGVFSPSLALGALVGAAVGFATAAVSPELSSGPAAYALVGMGATAAAVLGAPISTTLIIFELTGDYTLTLAVMLAVVIATLVSTQLFGFQSFFLAQLHDTGVQLEGGSDVSALKSVRVRDYITGPPPHGTVDMTQGEARQKLLAHNLDELYIVDDEGKLKGFVGGSALADLADGDLEQPVAPLLEAVTTVIRDDQVIESAVRLLLASGARRLPVVDGATGGRLCGILTARDLLSVIDQAQAEAAAETKGVRRRRIAE